MYRQKFTLFENSDHFVRYSKQLALAFFRYRSILYVTSVHRENVPKLFDFSTFSSCGKLKSLKVKRLGLNHARLGWTPSFQSLNLDATITVWESCSIIYTWCFLVFSTLTSRFSSILFFRNSLQLFNCFANRWTRLFAKCRRYLSTSGLSGPFPNFCHFSGSYVMPRLFSCLGCISLLTPPN